MEYATESTKAWKRQAIYMHQRGHGVTKGNDPSQEGLTGCSRKGVIGDRFGQNGEVG